VYCASCRPLLNSYKKVQVPQWSGMKQVTEQQPDSSEQHGSKKIVTLIYAVYTIIALSTFTTDNVSSLHNCVALLCCGNVWQQCEAIFNSAKLRNTSSAYYLSANNHAAFEASEPKKLSRSRNIFLKTGIMEPSISIDLRPHGSTELFVTDACMVPVLMIPIWVA
jgi:hypothetical protein